MIEKRRHTLPGWTLSETLVVMVLSGVVFLSIMEGASLLNRYARMRTNEITANMRLHEGYRTLQHLISQTDSASMEPAYITLFRDGSPLSSLALTDSLLVARTGIVSDTLLFGVSELHLGEDTLRVVVVGELVLRFPFRPLVSRRIVNSLQQQEKLYEYE